MKGFVSLNSQRWLSFGFLFFFITWGIFLPYWTGWLTNVQGLSVTSASIIMGVGMIVRSLSTFFLFPQLSKQQPLVSIIRWMTIGSIVFLLLYIPASSFTALLLITAAFSIFYPTILPAIESSASVLMQKEHIHYGKSRSYGSIGYTLALLAVGGLTGYFGEQAILYAMLVALVVVLFFFSQPAPQFLTQLPEKQPAEKRVTMKELFRSKQFLVIGILAVLLQGSHTAYYNYGFIYLDDLHVSGIWIGVILNIAVIFEILFFTNADRFFSKWKVSTMFMVASIGSTLRWVLIYLFPLTEVFVVTQVLHAVSFGFAHFAFIQYISHQLPEKHIPTAQGFYAAVAMSLSVALLTFPAGYLYDLQPGFAFLGMTLCSIPAIFIILTTKKKYNY